MINKLKTEDAGKLIMPAGKFLVELQKERKHSVVRNIPKVKKGEENKKDPLMELHEVKQREPYYVQFYKVIAAPEGETDYVVGDIILAPYSAGSMFDLINKTKVLNKFDVIAKFVQ